MQPKKTILNKIFQRSVWCLLSIFFAIFFTICIVGRNVARANDSFVNAALGIDPYETVTTDEDQVFNEYASDFVDEDGNLDNKAMRAHSLEVARQVADESAVLLKNENDALPLSQGDKISVFGIDTVSTMFCGSGSGHLGVTATDSLTSALTDDGLEANTKLNSVYRNLSSKYGSYLSNAGFTLSGDSVGDSCYVEYAINEAPWSSLDTTAIGNVTSTFSEYGDAAVFMIARQGGEDGDINYYAPECLENNYLDLTYEEVEVLNQLIALRNDGTFKKVILLLNSPVPMQMKHILTYDLDSIVWIGLGGNVIYKQVADILSGKANPSGHLPDTYAYDNYSAPSTVNQGDFSFTTTDGLPADSTYTHNTKYLVYSEDIYVGYRYYETRYEDSVLSQGNAASSKGVTTSASQWKYSEEVAYPFGYGKGYTTFSRSDFKVQENGDQYVVSQTITNTGSVAGKEVLQFYLQKPYTEYDKENRIEKASVELVGYAKTQELAPGEEETLSVTIDKEEFKTYDTYNQGTYILEKGTYYLSSGWNSHDALNNILASKGKTTSDGMDYDGDASYCKAIDIAEDDFETYSVSSATGNEITNQFSDADPTLYSGVKDQFTSFKYLSRSDWEGTYPEKAVMDCLTEEMRQDMQYTNGVEDDPTLTMPTFGKSGNLTLMQLWGYDYDDPKWDDLLDEVTWEEAVSLATYGGGTGGCASVAAPNSLAKDGPMGINVTADSLPSVMCFPSGPNLAATFNSELIEEMGNCFGMEILHAGYNGIYGPGANIHRSAYSGRNWEYFSEDPYLSGATLTPEVKGLQNRGVIVFTKHFALNDQERNRYGVTVWANEQTIREIYLKGFEMAVEDGQMNGIMSSFNRIGCYWSGRHSGLLTEVLRNEWGFIGVVQTDAYVGAHMHILAESVVAGNDFTMGGSDPTALDAYKNNKVVANALRETVHRILYTKLHSNTMNGLTYNTKIIYHTPWWDTTLTTLFYVMLSLDIISILCFAFSLVLPYFQKKKARWEAEPEHQGQKAHVFFDLMSKTATIVSACIAAILIATAIAVPIGIQNAKNANDNPIAENSDSSSTSEELVCDHACPICGLCMDPESTDELCQVKCGHDRKYTQTFEAEDDNTIREPGAKGELGVFQEEGANCTYVGAFNANVGAKIKFVLTSPADQTVSVYVSLSLRSNAVRITNSVLFSVNGELLDRSSTMRAKKDTESEWINFVSAGLGCVSLKAGRNYLSFTMAMGDVGSGFNFDSMTIKADQELSWYTGEHICDDVCPICGKCQDPYCSDPVCQDKCTCNLTKHDFPLSDDKATLSGTTLEDGKVTLDAAEDSLTWNFFAETDTTAVVFLTVEQFTGEALASDLFSITVNGTSGTIYSFISLTDITSSTQVKIGEINLTYGENVVELKALTDTSLTFSCLTLGTNDSVEYKNPYEFFAYREDKILIEGNAYINTSHVIDMTGSDVAGSEILFPIDSDQDTTATLTFKLAVRSTGASLADLFAVSVNGTAVSVSGSVPSEGRELAVYEEVTVADVSLVSGFNKISIQVLTNDSESNTYLQSIAFRNTEATLDWSEQSLVNILKVEAESCTLTTVTNEHGTFPYATTGQGASNDGYLGGINDAGLYNPGEAKITFTVTSDKAASCKFYFICGVAGSALASAYPVTVNGTEYTSTETWTGNGWYDWGSHYFGKINLAAGENTIVITLATNCSTNFDAFQLSSSAVMSQVV